MLKPIVSAYYPGCRILVVGDPAGVQRSQTDGSTCFKELRNAGFRAIPAKTNALAARIAAVDTLLTTNIKERGSDILVPRFRLSPSCSMLRKGLATEYKYPETHSQYGDIVRPTVLKNEYSHVCEALQYAALGYEKIHMAANADYEAKATEGYGRAKHSQDQIKGALY